MIINSMTIKDQGNLNESEIIILVEQPKNEYYTDLFFSNRSLYIDLSFLWDIVVASFSLTSFVLIILILSRDN